MLSWTEIETRAIAFQKRWKDCEGHEKQEAQTFEKDFMTIFGVDFLEGHHEYPITDLDGKDGYIDYLLPGKILIEMKSKGESLTRAYNQAYNYYRALPAEKQPKLIICCDFKYFEVKNMETGQAYKKFDISRLKNHVRMFGNIAGYGIDDSNVQTDIEVNTDASYKLAEVHDQLKKHGYEGHQLEVYLVRLLFCLFAEDTGIFEKKSFENYVKDTKEDGSDLSAKLMLLFDVLNTPPEKRMSNLPDDLKRFRYINGGVFKEILKPAFFDKKMRKVLLHCCSFDWSYISPAIFGAMFQGVMDQEERRTLGAHYTEEDNILKVIKPLFLDELWKEFDIKKNTKKELEEFHRKICSLKFLDPAAGCFNFGIIAYRELRLLEFEIYKLLLDDQRMVLFDTLEHVSINQFYAIECEEFPCRIGEVAMLLMKHQMDQLISNYFGFNSIDFPIRENANIVHANALRIDWNTVIDKNELNYIMGNPPFIGHQNRNDEQVEDMKIAFSDLQKHGKLDYVCCWYNVAASYMSNTKIQCAFVSTNSIIQGEPVSILWEHLFKNKNVEIQFAYRPFVWDSKANNKAHVHCVIIGFTACKCSTKKTIFFEDKAVDASYINAYLFDAADLYIKGRGKPLYSFLKIMTKGSQPTDDGYLILSEEEKNKLQKKYPITQNFIKEYIGGYEFINGKKRYCLWLKDVSPSLYNNIPEIKDRLLSVADFRRQSPTKSVQKDALTPMLFTQIRQPNTNYLVVPETSTQNRNYIPIGYLDKNIICSNSIRYIPTSSLYIFGILTSSIHMAWTKTVCGRLKSDFRYSPSIYNNFPWCEPTSEQKKKIEETAQAILDARSMYPDCSLADLYDRLLMPFELRKAHEANDKAVMKIYGFKSSMTEDEIVAELFKLYQKKVEEIGM